jgi:hypothetical protein
VPDIVATLAKEYPENAEGIAGDVEETIGRLAEERLIVFVKAD